MGDIEEIQEQLNKAFFRNAAYKHGEPNQHFFCKQFVRALAKKQGWAVEEEVDRSVDLHDVLPELYPKKSMRGYKLDLLLTRKVGKEIKMIGVEIDGPSHLDRVDKDIIRDQAIPAKYGHRVVRFDRDAMLAGDITEAEIIRRLGL